MLLIILLKYTIKMLLKFSSNIFSSNISLYIEILLQYVLAMLLQLQNF